MATNGAVKVTYIETQFVTSDAASFKATVQRLTGKSAQDSAEPARQLHRPRPSRPGADGYMPIAARSASTAADEVQTAATAANAGASQPCLDEMQWLCDYSELMSVVGASEQRRGASYSDLLY